MNWLGSTSFVPQSSTANFGSNNQQMGMTNDMAPQPQPQGLASGGAAGLMSDDVVHMAPDELEVMDLIQGGPEYDKTTGLKSYKKLAQLLKNQHVLNAGLERHFAGGRVGHAKGGLTIDIISAKGRGGDSKLAKVPKKLQKLFDRIMGGVSHNPHTNKKEYFGLRDFFSGVYNTINPYAQAAYNAVSPYAQSAYSTMADTARALPGMAGQAALDFAGAKDAQDLMGMAGRGALTAAGSIADQMSQGRSFSDSLRPAIDQSFASFDTPAGRFGREALKGAYGDTDMRTAMLQGAQSAARGDDPLSSAVRAGATSQLRGRSPYESAMNMASAGLQATDDPRFAGMKQGLSNFRSGRASPYQAGAQALAPMLPQQGIAAPLQSGLSAYGQSGNVNQALGAAGRSGIQQAQNYMAQRQAAQAAPAQPSQQPAPQQMVPAQMPISNYRQNLDYLMGAQQIMAPNTHTMANYQRALMP